MENKINITNKEIRQKIKENVRPSDIRDIVKKVSESEIDIDGQDYKIVENYREALDFAKINERFDDYLFKFDYIVGDIAGNQLRLRGFYDDDTKGIHRDQKHSTIQDYLIEYCNFDCPFFVIQKIANKRDDKTVKNTSKSKSRNSREENTVKNLTPKISVNTKPNKTKKIIDKNQSSNVKNFGSKIKTKITNGAATKPQAKKIDGNLITQIARKKLTETKGESDA